MKTKPWVVLLLASSLCSIAIAGLNVRDFNPAEQITGRLGRPLGTRMSIEGKLSPAMTTNPLGVSQIDGHTLTNVVVISIRGEVKLQEGVLYRFEGYESGEFSGPPVWLSPHMQQPFQYRSFFVVTKIIVPAR